MNYRSASRILVSAAFALALGVALKVRGAPAGAAPPAKMPELKKDYSPVSDGKSSVITSYADIVEAAEKEVVSINSTRTVHERVQANPLLRQFFGDVPDQDRESK
jgi:serine protease Do/serine protease DegQ